MVHSCSALKTHNDATYHPRIQSNSIHPVVLLATIAYSHQSIFFFRPGKPPISELRNLRGRPGDSPSSNPETMALATHLLRRSLLTASPRATAFTPSSSSTRALLLTPTTKILSSQQQSRLLSISARARAANPQAGGPTSKDAGHAAKNIKEEAAAVGSSIASAIGGRSGMTEKKSGKEESGGSGMSAILEDAKTIGGEMAKAVPQPALIWGAAGIIPYVSTAAASIWLARQAKLVSEGEQHRF